VDSFARLVARLRRDAVRFVIIGIGLSGANYYARSTGALFVTQDRGDLGRGRERYSMAIHRARLPTRRWDR